MVYEPIAIEYILCQTFQDLFPIFEYHDRWKDLLRSPSEEQSADMRSSMKGFWTDGASRPADATVHMAADNRIAKIPLRNELYLRLMIDHCRRIGATPLLVSTPSTINWNTARHKGMAAFAEEYKIAYVDLNVAPTKVSIDWATDTRDAGDHVNLSGAKKVSKYMGSYLSKTYGLVDRRGDASYQSWNDALARYKQASS